MPEDGSRHDFDLAYEDDRDLFGEPYPALLEWFDRRPPGTVLDLGCGQGRNAVALAGRGHRVTALDTSAVGVAQAVGRGRAAGLPVDGVVADLVACPLRGRFDVVLVDMVLHGLDDADRRAVLPELPTLVRPGGTLVVVGPERGPAVAAVEQAGPGWPMEVVSMTHRLEHGEHRGTYEFTAVIADRPD